MGSLCRVENDETFPVLQVMEGDALRYMVLVTQLQVNCMWVYGFACLFAYLFVYERYKCIPTDKEC